MCTNVALPAQVFAHWCQTTCDCVTSIKSGAPLHQSAPGRQQRSAKQGQYECQHPINSGADRHSNEEAPPRRAIVRAVPLALSISDNLV